MQDKQKHQFDKLQKRLLHQVGDVIADFSMIEDGDKVMVCLSGGKDSYAMLDILMRLKSYAPISFSLIAVNVDQGQPGFPQAVLPDYLTKRDIPFQIVKQDTYRIVQEKIPQGKTTCSLCSRLRRGILYRVAKELGVTKIALGHHREDIIETFFLNMFYGGRLKAMPPKLISDDQHNVIIRPMAYCKEADLIQFADYKQFPIIPCNLCGSQQNAQRKVIKNMLSEWDKQQPGRIENIFRSLSKITPSHLLDRQLYPF